jgi:hypothetical protein
MTLSEGPSIGIGGGQGFAPRLRELGYTDAEISKMNPVQQQDIVEKGTEPARAESTARVTKGQVAPTAEPTAEGPVRPEAPPKLKVTAHRGLGKGRLGKEGGHQFWSASKDEAKKYAESDEDVITEEISFSNPLVVDNWVDAKKKLGLPNDTPMGDILDAAANAGYDGISWKHHGVQEYVKLNKPAAPISTAAAPTPNKETVAKMKELDKVEEKMSSGAKKLNAPAKKAFNEMVASDPRLEQVKRVNFEKAVTDLEKSGKLKVRCP